MAQPDGASPYTWGFNHGLTINTVMVGLNYHLGCCDNAIPLK
jgi:hypothetical protein